MAKSRNLYPAWIDFIQTAISDLEKRGHGVEIAAILYHVGENDMSFGPFRKSAPKHLRNLVESTRKDLGLPDLRWIVSQQTPTQDERVSEIDVVADIAEIAEDDRYMMHVTHLELPPQEKQLVINTAGIIRLGEVLAEAFQESQSR